MKKTGATKQGLTRGDKAHKKNLEKSKIFESGLKQVFNSSTVIHKQTIDAKIESMKLNSKSWEAEQLSLYEIIKNPEIDEKTKVWAQNRIEEHSLAQEKTDKDFDEFLENAEKKPYAIIWDGLILSALIVTGVLTISTKRGRQMISTALTTDKTYYIK